MFEPGQSNFLQALGWAVFNSLWQMALLWVVYQLTTAVLRTKKSSEKAFLATTLLFLGFGWFAFTFFSVLSDAAAVKQGYSAFVTFSNDGYLHKWLSTALPVASVVYLVLLILPSLNLIRNFRYVNFIKTHGLKKADVRWRLFSQKVASHMGIRKPVQVWMSELVSSPVTIGFLKPLILLPVAAINQLTASQVEAILLHELSHIRRADYLVNLLTRFIQTILYFNPFVKAFARIIEKEREKHCDEIVLQFQYEPHGYASALLQLEKTAGNAQRLLAVAAAGSRKNELLTRIESIMGIRKKQVFSFNRLAGIAAALVCFFALNALLVLGKAGHSTATPHLLTDISGPFSFIEPPQIREDFALQPVERKADQRVVNHVDAVAPQINVERKGAALNDPLSVVEVTPTQATPMLALANMSPFTLVSLKENVIPELDKQQQAQVKEALEASKKIISEEKWKDMEQAMADAVNEAEKEKIKAAYDKAISKLDWEKIEDKLKVAYDNINWNQLNTELSRALVEIKLDSLQKAYTTTISNLSCLEKELRQTEEAGIPDTDVTLKSVDDKKKEVMKAINIIKAVKTRKIVHL